MLDIENFKLIIDSLNLQYLGNLDVIVRYNMTDYLEE